jgi:hypothetical protein
MLRLQAPGQRVRMWYPCQGMGERLVEVRVMFTACIACNARCVMQAACNSTRDYGQ